MSHMLRKPPDAVTPQEREQGKVHYNLVKRPSPMYTYTYVPHMEDTAGLSSVSFSLSYSLPPTPSLSFAHTSPPLIKHTPLPFPLSTIDRPLPSARSTGSGPPTPQKSSVSPPKQPRS